MWLDTVFSVWHSVLISGGRRATGDHSPPKQRSSGDFKAQEQVEYMIVEDADAPFFLDDDHVKSEVRTCLSKIFSMFEVQVNSLSLQSADSLEAAEKIILKSLSDIEWMSNILPKMDLMKDFVKSWLDVSDSVLAILQMENSGSCLWEFKRKILEVVGKVLEAIGYGNVVIPAPSRVHMLKIWLPYIRQCKLLVELQDSNVRLLLLDIGSDLCDNIEAAIIPLVLALPSTDQADILSDWLATEKVKYPDLSEAFELWCYRSKAAKRRCTVDLNGSGNAVP